MKCDLNKTVTEKIDGAVLSLKADFESVIEQIAIVKDLTDKQITGLTDELVSLNLKVNGIDDRLGISEKKMSRAELDANTAQQL